MRRSWKTTRRRATHQLRGVVGARAAAGVAGVGAKPRPPQLASSGSRRVARVGAARRKCRTVMRRKKRMCRRRSLRGMTAMMTILSDV
jgi:hypothetical protein